MKKEEFYYDSRDDKSKIYAVKYMPDEEKPKCIVQIIHGMCEHMGRYDGIIEYLVDKGCVVVGEDHLGHGKTAEAGHGFSYFCKQDPATVVVRDVHRLKKMIQKQYPGVPYVILGHSMGSFIMRNYLTMYGSGIDGSVIMGTGRIPGAFLAVSKVMVKVMKLFRGDHHVSKLCEKLTFGNYNSHIEHPTSPISWHTKDDADNALFAADPLCGHPFTLNGYETLLALTSRSQDPKRLAQIPSDLPLLVISGEEDPLGEWGAGIPVVVKGLKDAGVKDVEVSMWPGDRHEILHETDKDKVMDTIYNWIQAKCI